ncbi:MAG: tetratricopeptide repeat protein [Aestuariivirga sp.]|nr:tetratricopeptide repeat protein [Aestuariivirga sp.]
MSLIVASNDSSPAECVSAFRKRKIKAAIGQCETYLAGGKGTARDRATAMFILGRAQIHSVGGGESKALELWRGAAEFDPSYIEPHILIGNLFGDSGKVAQAQAAYDRAAEINAKDWRIYAGRARIYIKPRTAATDADALRAAEQAVALKPDAAYARMVYGRILQMAGKYEESARQFEAAIGGDDPSGDASFVLIGEPHPLEALAYVYNQMGKPAVAAETLGKYMDTIPVAERYYADYQQRAEYYELAGMYAMAAADFGEAASRAPAEYAEELLAKDGRNAGDELRSVLARGSLKPTLKVQVFLRNQGYDEVTINGRYDDATKRALDACLLDKACAPGIGQAI